MLIKIKNKIVFTYLVYRINKENMFEALNTQLKQFVNLNSYIQQNTKLTSKLKYLCQYV